MKKVLIVLLVGLWLVAACNQGPSAQPVGVTATAPATALSSATALPPVRTAALEFVAGPLPGRIAISPATVDRVEKLHALGGHRPSVAGLAFLSDGGRLASVSKDFSLRLWDVGTGQELRGPVGRGERVYNVAFAPGGALMATEGAEQTIEMWDVGSGQRVRTLDGHGTHLLCMAFSPDGRLLASAGDDAVIKVWDVESGLELLTLGGNLTPVTSLAFSPDGAVLASGAAWFNTVIKIWDVTSGEVVRTFTGHTHNVHSLAFSPDGTLLASAGLDRTLRLWRVKSGQVIHTLKEKGDPVYGLAFSPDGALLASAGDHGDVVFWDVQTGQALRTLSGHNNSVLDLAFSPDGSVLASGGIDSTVLLWAVDGGGSPSGQVRRSQALPDPAVLPLAPLSGDRGGVIAFSSYREGEAKIYTMHADGAEITCLSRTSRRETRPAWSPDGSRIAYVRRVSHSDHEIYMMNADGSGVTRLTHRPDSIESEPAWSPDGSRIAFISNERLSLLTFSGRFHIWVMNADGSEPTLLSEVGGTNTSPDWSPDGKRLVFDSSRDGNHEIYVMDADGSAPLNLTRHPAHDTSPAWSPDGGKIAFVSDRDGNEEIYVMNSDGTGQTRLTARNGFDKAPSWSPDGRFIVFYSRHQDNNTEVYRMRADGSEQVRLTRDADFDGFPAWQPSSRVSEVVVAPETVESAATAQGPIAESPAPDQSSVGEVVASLEGLPLDQFFEESFKQLMLRDPEWVTGEGLADRFATGHGQLTDLSDSYVRETHRVHAAVLDLLRQYDRDVLTPEQQISYDVYEWYLDDLVRGQEFMYYDYPVTHFTTGIQHQLIQLFTDLHPIASLQDAEDYVRRLYQVRDKFVGLIEGLRRREEEGVVLPKPIFPWLTGDIHKIARGQPQYTPFYTAFEEKVNALEDLAPGERLALLEAAKDAIAESVIPAFSALAEALDHLQSAAPASGGVWQLPNGRAYYDYILRHHTTTDLTADEIHELGRQELQRIHAEMRALFDQLGYSPDASIRDLYARLSRDGGAVSGSRVAETYETLIGEAERNLGAAFDISPKADVVVIAGPQGDYYLSASLDGSRPGAFYARVSGGETALYGMPTLAYHEAVPGHHYQIALTQESDLPLFRNVVGFTGYTEGWALYAEQLAYELGWYDEDLYGNLGRLQAQAFRAARLVVDTGLHAKGWTFEQAHQFMVENVGRDPGYLQFEVTRYITWPGQATAYMVGMLEIMELRQRAMDLLGDQFDLKEFHRVVLSNGSMPLEILERVIDDYVEVKLSGG